MDQFAQIAANGIGGRMELLKQPEPEKYVKKLCVLKETKENPVKVEPKMSTKEELLTELSKMRKKYQVQGLVKSLR